MKIGHLENKLPLAPVAGERKTATPATPAAGPAAQTKVELSSTAAALANPVAGDGSFDAAKVERISKALKEGTFKVNPEAIADKLIANAQELLSRTKS